jgi:hypothetical protein
MERECEGPGSQGGSAKTDVRLRHMGCPISSSRSRTWKPLGALWVYASRKPVIIVIRLHHGFFMHVPYFSILRRFHLFGF